MADSHVYFIGRIGSGGLTHGDPPFSGTIGEKLSELSGLPHNEWLMRTRRINLADNWPATKLPKERRQEIAEARCDALKERTEGVFVLVGHYVAEMFGFKNLCPYGSHTIGRKTYVVIPQRISAKHEQDVRYLLERLFRQEPADASI